MDDREQFCESSECSAETRLTPALAFVESNFAQKVTLGAAAKLCGLGRYQFSRAFKQAHGKTFREFIIIHRIQKAAQMMCLADVSITDVAFSVGFNDLSHFAQMFRRYMGMRPSDYVQGRSRTAVRMTATFLMAPELAMQKPRDGMQKNPSFHWMRAATTRQHTDAIRASVPRAEQGNPCEL